MEIISQHSPSVAIMKSSSPMLILQTKYSASLPPSYPPTNKGEKIKKYMFLESWEKREEFLLYNSTPVKKENRQRKSFMVCQDRDAAFQMISQPEMWQQSIRELPGLKEPCFWGTQDVIDKQWQDSHCCHTHMHTRVRPWDSGISWRVGGNTSKGRVYLTSSLIPLQQQRSVKSKI